MHILTQSRLKVQSDFKDVSFLLVSICWVREDRYYEEGVGRRRIGGGGGGEEEGKRRRKNSEFSPRDASSSLTTRKLEVTL